MITVCTGIKNRSTSLIKFLIASMNECKQKEQLSLSVFDCDSNDVKDLREEIRKYWKGHLIFKSEKKSFSRSYAFNNAVLQATSDKLFICDIDMTLPINFVAMYHKFVNPNQIWFPICFSLYKKKARQVASGNGWWRIEGYGMMGLYKETFMDIKYNEKFVKWGGEDEDFYKRAIKKYKSIRGNVNGLFHNWHKPAKGGRSIP